MCSKNNEGIIKRSHKGNLDMPIKEGHVFILAFTHVQKIYYFCKWEKCSGHMSEV